MDNKAPAFLQMDVRMYESKVFLALSPATRDLYTAICAKAKKNDTFTFTWGDAKRIGYTSSATFRSRMSELIEAGFIEVVTSGKNLRTASDYRFSMRWKRKENGINEPKI